VRDDLVPAHEPRLQAAHRPWCRSSHRADSERRPDAAAPDGPLRRPRGHARSRRVPRLHRAVEHARVHPGAGTTSLGRVSPKMSSKPLDPLVASMSERGREFLARIGRRFGSVEVLAQAERTLRAHEQFGAQVRLHGFSSDDAKLLAAARDAAAARTRARPKLTDATYVSALEQAKHGRTRVRSVLSSAYRRLRMTGGAQ